MKVKTDIRPSTRASARALGFYDRPVRPIDMEHLRELEEQERRRYFWFPPDAVEQGADTDLLASHLDGHVRAHSLGVYLWGGAVWEQQQAQREAEALTAVTRGLFRRVLRQRGFTGPIMETALEAFLAGRTVDVRQVANGPDELLVNGRTVARNLVALNLRLTPLAPTGAYVDEVARPREGR